MRRRGLIPLVFILLVTVGGLTWTVVTDTSPQLGLDLQGGASVVLAPAGEVEDDTLDEAVSIIRNRVDALGVAEPVIARQGNNVVVELPGVDNQQRALDLVGETAELQFRPVCGLLPPFGTLLPEEDSATLEGEVPPADGDGAETPAEGDGEPPADQDAEAGDEGAAPRFAGVGELAGGTDAPAPGEADDIPDDTTTSTVAPGEPSELPLDPATATAGPSGAVPCPTDQTDVGPDRDLCQEPEEEVATDEVVVLPQCDDDNRELSLEDGGFRYLVGPALLTGQALETASAGTSAQEIGQWEVRPVFRGGEEGIDLFNQAAAICFAGGAACPVVSPQGQNGQLAIVLDDVVVSAPGIQQPSFQRDQIVISGSFSESEAKDLSTALKYGALPVELETQAVQTVSPSLGEDSLRAGIIAGAIGVVLVCVYLILYYRVLALIALLSLLVWAGLLWATICFLSVNIGLALTLAGVVGLIVSVGVTVDSYIVYFERWKDDVRKGQTPRSSAAKSFDRSFRTIVTANVAALIGSITLYLLTVGAVRGFAFFLGVATVLDIVIVWFFTRPLAVTLARTRWVSRAGYLRTRAAKDAAQEVVS